MNEIEQESLHADDSICAKFLKRQSYRNGEEISCCHGLRVGMQVGGRGWGW